jgi:hypothetical protein
MSWTRINRIPKRPYLSPSERAAKRSQQDAAWVIRNPEAEGKTHLPPKEDIKRGRELLRIRETERQVLVHGLHLLIQKCVAQDGEWRAKQPPEMPFDDEFGFNTIRAYRLLHTFGGSDGI